MAADPYTQPQNPATGPQAARVSPGAAFSRALPAITTTATLALGRYWHAHGAAHSIGDAILTGALAAGCTIGAAVADDPTSTALALGLAGGCAAAGVMAYSGEMALPLLVWALSTSAAYALARRTWRTERREHAEHDRHMEADRTRYDHEIQVEAIRTHASEVAAQYTVTAEAYRARALAAVIGARTAIPDVDPAVFALSPGARAALEPATVQLSSRVAPSRSRRTYPPSDALSPAPARHPRRGGRGRSRTTTLEGGAVMARSDYPSNLATEDQVPQDLPRHPNAEMAVIGAALTSPTVLAELLEMIEPGDFYEVRHEVIWNAIERLNAYGRPADLVSVTTELGRELNKCGGPVYLHDCIEAVPTALNGPYYAELLRDYAYARKVILGGIRLAQMGRTEIEDDLKAAVRRQLQEIAETDRRGWDAPIPLRRIRDVPPFPIGALPTWIRAKAEVTAYQTQTPVDLAGTLALACLATAAGGIVYVDVRPEHGWSEPTNLYLVGALPPASRKSPVFNAMTAPILATEAQLQAEAKTRIIELSVERKAAEDYAVRMADKLAKAPPGEADSARYEAQQAALAAEAITVPKDPRLFTDDATAETATSLLVEQGGKFAVLSAESEVFNEIAGRYSGNPNMNVFLKGHAGDPIRVDRKGRASEAVDRPALTLGICTQPSALADLAAVPGAAGRGLLARFLFTMPPSNIGYRDPKPGAVDRSVHAVYASKLQLLILALRDLDAPIHLTLGRDATALLDQVAEETETQLREGGRLAGYTDWGGKSVGAMMRIAGLLHLAEYGTDGFTRPINGATLTAARDLICYFTEHSLAVFETMTTDDVAERAGSVLTNLTNTATTRFTARDLFTNLSRSRFPKMADLEAALTLLEQHGYLRRLQAAPTSSRAGRPRAPVYEAHPDLAS